MASASIPGQGLEWSTKFRIESSDVISSTSHLTSVYSLPSSWTPSAPSQLIYYLERYLTEEEIVEHIIHNSTRQILWEIHRPKRGWYIRIRAPSFPQGVWIPLMPVQREEKGLYVDAALRIRVRTYEGHPNAAPVPKPPVMGEPSGSSGASSAGSLTSTHVYPPTPPLAPSALATVIVQPPSPRSIQQEFDRVASQVATDGPGKRGHRPHLPPGSLSGRPPVDIGHISEFLLSPYLPLSDANPTAQGATTSSASSIAWAYLSRAFQVIKEHTPVVIGSSETEFVVSRVHYGNGRSKVIHGTNGNANGSLSPPPRYTSSPPSPIASPPLSTTSSVGSTMTLLPTVAPSSPPLVSSTTPQAQTEAQSTPSPSYQSSKSQSTLHHLFPIIHYTSTTPSSWGTSLSSFSVATQSGTLSLHTEEMRKMGVDESFWVCLGLVYSGFLGEREGYLAALSD